MAGKLGNNEAKARVLVGLTMAGTMMVCAANVPAQSASAAAESPEEAPHGSRGLKKPNRASSFIGDSTPFRLASGRASQCRVSVNGSEPVKNSGC